MDELRHTVTEPKRNLDQKFPLENKDRCLTSQQPCRDELVAKFRGIRRGIGYISFAGILSSNLVCDINLE